jgi:RimJ/RimL family protein N-acetyltransferase
MLTSADAKLWKEFRLHALKVSPLTFASTYQEEVTKDDEYWERSCQRAAIFGAFIENKLVGGVGFFVYEQERMKHKERFFGMYVNPEHRGKGIAGKLLQTVIDHAKTKVIQLTCSVMVVNEPAVALYRKYGFTSWGIESRALCVDGIYRDDHHMVLKFDTDKN